MPADPPPADPPPAEAPPAEAKAAIRRRLLTARADLADLDATARSLQAHLLDQPFAAPGHVVAAYVPVGREPGSVDLLDALVARGVRVLLPVVVGRELDWAVYDGDLRTGPWRLREPTGTPLGVAALGTVDVVLVPALAVDRDGARLGKGAGFYDRALTFVRVGTPLLAVLHDGEVLDEPLPVEDHDVPMTGAVTPTGGVVPLGADDRPDSTPGTVVAG